MLLVRGLWATVTCFSSFSPARTCRCNNTWLAQASPRVHHVFYLAWNIQPMLAFASYVKKAFAASSRGIGSGTTNLPLLSRPGGSRFWLAG